jgi:hypothetical protein
MWYLVARQLKAHLLRSSSRRRTTTSIIKMKTMKSTLPCVTTKERSCIEMLMKGNPSVLKPRSLPVGFMPYWDTWASPLPQDTSSRESHVQGRWNLRQLQRSSLDLGSSVGTRGQPSEHLSVMLWLMPPGRPSLLGVVATGMNSRTLSTASYLGERMSNSRPLGCRRMP